MSAETVVGRYAVIPPMPRVRAWKPPKDTRLEAPHAEPPNRCPNDGAWVTPGNDCTCCGRTS